MPPVAEVRCRHRGRHGEHILRRRSRAHDDGSVTHG